MSRPLRAACGVIGGWIALRAVMLWDGVPVTVAKKAVAAAAPVPAQTATLDPVPPRLTGPAAGTHSPGKTRGTIRRSSSAAHAPDRVANAPSPSLAALPPLNDRPAPSAGNSKTAFFAFPPLPSAPQQRARDRFQLSGWMLVRGATSPGGLAPGGTLGGAQAGVRGWYEPGPKGLAITARVSTLLGQRYGSEATVGIGFRKGNFGAIVEERISLDAGGGARPSVTLFGGVSDVRLPGKLRLDGYAQAGIVGLRNRTGFADGALRVERPIADAPVRLAVGAGAWGGAQPGLARLDIGPQLAARVPVAGGTIRIAGEWRFRVAGSATPGSGPVLSIGADF